MRIPILLLLASALLLGACGSGQISQQARSAQYQVRLTLDAATTGSRVALIDIHDREGHPVAAERVIVAPAMVGMGHSVPELVATMEAPGRYRAAGALFSMLGEWEIAVSVGTDGPSETVRFLVRVAS